MEKSIYSSEILEKILKLYSFAQKRLREGSRKKILETIDSAEDSVMHYRYINLNDYQMYLDFSNHFLSSKKKESIF